MQICYIGGVDMATVPTQVRIDENLKKEGKRAFFAVRNGYVQRNEYISQTVCYERGSSI